MQLLSLVQLHVGFSSLINSDALFSFCFFAERVLEKLEQAIVKLEEFNPEGVVRDFLRGLLER